MQEYKVENGEVVCVITSSSKKNLYEKIVCGNDITIKGYRYNMDTGETFVKLEFLDVVRNKLVCVEVNRAKLTSNELDKLIKNKGGIILDKNRMLHFLNEKERKLLVASAVRASRKGGMFYEICKGQSVGNPTEDSSKELPLKQKQVPDYYNVTASCSDKIEVYSHLGWESTEDGQLFFKGAKCVGINPESEYVGTLKVQIKGTFENVKKLYDDYIWDSVELQVISAIAASATVLGFMSIKCDLVLSNCIFSLSSRTTTGKSTALEMAASFGGCPIVEEENTLAMSFEGTANKIINNMGVNKGYPVCIDDTKLADYALKKQMTEFLYSLSRGSEKERMHGIKLAQFRTTILISGERSIMEFVKDVGGLAVRILEFQDVAWTKNAESANEIKRIVRANYGHLTLKLAEKLLDCSKDDDGMKLRERFDFWYKRFVDDSKDQLVYMEYTERIVTSLALVMLSLELLGEVMGHEVNQEGVYAFLFEKIIIRVAEDTNIGDRAYKAIIDCWKENPYKFMISKKPVVAFSDVGQKPGETRLHPHIGVVAPTKSKHTIDGKVYDRMICLTSNQVKKILSKAGLDDEWNCMREIGKKGLLLKHNPNTDNPTGFYISGGNHMKGYKVLLERGSDTNVFDSLEEQAEREEQQITQEESDTQVSDLLENQVK